MRNLSYLDRIDAMISETNNRLQKLIAAREVILEITRADEPTASVGPTAVQEEVDERPSRQTLKSLLISAIKVDPQTSTDLIERYAPDGSKVERQRIYTALSELAKSGIVTRDEDRIYTMREHL